VLVEVWFGTQSSSTRMPAIVQPRRSAVEVGEGAEHRVDVAVVGDVVAEVGHRRAVDRRQPDRVDPEPREVVEPIDDPSRSPTPSPSVSANERG
jgi:hypothetical protein